MRSRYAKLVREREIAVQGRFLGLMAGGNQSSNQVDQEVDRTAVARMLDLTDIFELIGDGLNDSSLA